MNAFLLLLLAIASELVGTTALKLSDGMTKLAPTVLVFVGYGAAFWLLSLVLRTLSVGVSYAIWSGLGTAGIAVIGVLWFGEKLGAVQFGGIALIIAGVVLLNTNVQSAH